MSTGICSRDAYWRVESRPLPTEIDAVTAWWPHRRSQPVWARIEVAFPDADEDTLRDTLAGMTKLTEMLAEVVRSRLKDQCLASAPRSRVSPLHSARHRVKLTN